MENLPHPQRSGEEKKLDFLIYLLHFHFLFLFISSPFSTSFYPSPPSSIYLMRKDKKDSVFK